MTVLSKDVKQRNLAGIAGNWGSRGSHVGNLWGVPDHVEHTPALDPGKWKTCSPENLSRSVYSGPRQSSGQAAVASCTGLWLRSERGRC